MAILPPVGWGDWYRPSIGTSCITLVELVSTSVPVSGSDVIVTHYR